MLPLNRDFLGGKIEFKPGFLKIFIRFLFISGDFKKMNFFRRRKNPGLKVPGLTVTSLYSFFVHYR